MHPRTSWTRWARDNLFSDWFNTTLTLLATALLIWLLAHMLPWLLFNAVWRVDLAACRAAHGEGACWGVIGEKWRLIVFGRYPFDQIWRPTLACVLIVGGVVAACYRPWWGKWLFAGSAVAIALALLILGGKWVGLSPVNAELWGGLPLTLLLAVIGSVLAFPLGILLALGRRSSLPFIKAVSVVYIELIRGVPLITVLFVASFLFPLFMPVGVEINVLTRVLAGITLFAAAYTAEVVRGGLQAIPRGQIEAAQALGLSYWQCMRKVVLPQALRLVVPPMMNSFISTFKDTSLVIIVSMFDLMGALKMAMGDPLWRSFHTEGYFFLALIYFIFCFSMSRYSAWLERGFHATAHR